MPRVFRLMAEEELNKYNDFKFSVDKDTDMLYYQWDCVINKNDKVSIG